MRVEHWTRELWAALLCASVAFCCVARVRADAPNQAENVAQYVELLQHGVDAFAAGEWAEARIFFERAHTILPTARTLRGLALCDFELGHYLLAIAECQSSLVDPRRPLTPDLRAQIEDTLTRARRNVGHLHLVLPQEVSELRVDGASMSVPADGTLLLDPGQHTLLVSMPDAEPITRTFTVGIGARENLIFAGRYAGHPQASALPSASEPLAAPPPPLMAADQTPSTPWTRPYLWAALGASGLFAAGIVGFGLATRSEHTAFAAEYRSYQLQREAGADVPAPSDAHRSAGRRWQLLTNLSIVGCASAALAAGALLLAGEHAPRDAPLSWSIGVGPGTASAAVSVRAF